LASHDKNETGSSKAGENEKRSKDMPVKSKDDMQQRLGLGLKNMYLNVLDEPLPDDILALLDQLDVEDEDNSDSGRSDVNE
tara:strand:+ start:1050 stop:1292 length:243 start_codon:yes stop_codon:yes gene_type:complete